MLTLAVDAREAIEFSVEGKVVGHLFFHHDIKTGRMRASFALPAAVTIKRIPRVDMPKPPAKKERRHASS